MQKVMKMPDQTTSMEGEQARGRLTLKVGESLEVKELAELVHLHIVSVK
jgi:hypothetical protein